MIAWLFAADSLIVDRQGRPLESRCSLIATLEPADRAGFTALLARAFHGEVVACTARVVGVGRQTWQLIPIHDEGDIVSVELFASAAPLESQPVD